MRLIKMQEYSYLNHSHLDTHSFNRNSRVNCRKGFSYKKV